MTEGTTVSLKLFREYGTVGRVVVRVYTEYIHNMNELRARTKGSYNFVEFRDSEVEFLAGESAKSVSLRVFRDTINEKTTKIVLVNLEYREGVPAIIGRRTCTLTIYDVTGADAYYSRVALQGYDGVSSVVGLTAGISQTVNVYSYSDQTTKKTDGADIYFGILESNTSSGTDWTVSDVALAAYQSDNLYSFSVALGSARSNYRVSAFLAINGVRMRYYRNTAFAQNEFVDRVEDYLPRTFSSDTNSTLLSVLAEAMVKAPVTGTYTIYSSAAYGGNVTVYVNGTAVLTYAETVAGTTMSGYSCIASEKSTTVSLIAGKYYYLSVRYANGEGTPCINLRWANSATAGEVDIPLSSLFALSSISGSPYLLATN